MDLVVIPNPQWRAKIQELLAMSAAERAHTWLGQAERTVDSIVQLSLIYYARKLAGDTGLDKLSRCFRTLMERIVEGRMLPETFIQFKYKAKLLASTLPIAEQRNFADGQRYALVVLDGGKTTTLMVDVHTLTDQQAGQLFGDGFIRDESEQRTWLADREQKKSKPLPNSFAFIVNGKITEPNRELFERYGKKRGWL